ncbi:hypothetical protein [Phormidesmis priestleyi]
MAKKRLGLGLIPIALPLLLLLPMPVLACGYSDTLCSLRNTFHNTVDRYVGNDGSQMPDPESVGRVTRPRTIEDDMQRYRQSADPRLRTLTYLSYPQNERSITRRIGIPDYRGQDGGYYQTSEGDVLVWYVGTRATGFRVIK